MASSLEIYDDVAYVYDGTIEGLLTAIFMAYANREDPTDVVSGDNLQPRLGQRVYSVETDDALSERVRIGVTKKCGNRTFYAILRASVSSKLDAGTAIYRFVRYAFDEHDGKSRAISNIAHPSVNPLHNILVSVNNECEKMRQFARFEHLRGEGKDIWFAKVNPKDSVVPLVMNHFIERFNVQPFILYDENHDVAGVYEGTRWYMVRQCGEVLLDQIPAKCTEQVQIENAWRKFYKAVAIDSRYNPELRRNFMPVRFWKNITEMQEVLPALAVKR